jgi:hypothetical protein
VTFLERIPGYKPKTAWLRQIMAEWARHGYGDVQHHVRSDTLLCTRDGQTSRHALAPHFGHYMGQQWLERERSVEQAVLNMITERELQLRPTPDVSMLRPVVRDRAFGWFRDARQGATPSEAQSLARGPAIGQDHQVYLAIQRPEHRQLITRQQVDELGLNLSQALDRAQDNLLRISQPRWRAIGPDAWEGAWDDGFECSRLLLPEVVLPLDLAGEAVAITPLHNKLLVSTRRSTAGQRAILEAALQAGSVDSSWSSSHMLSLDARGRWQPYEPSHAAAQQLQRRLAVTIARSQYQQQQPLLTQALQSLGRPFEVTDYDTVETPDDLTSVAIWIKGHDTFLPRAQHLALIDPDHFSREQTLVVPWDLAVDYLAPHLNPVAGVEPPRYHATLFPSNEVLQSLRARQAAA